MSLLVRLFRSADDLLRRGSGGREGSSAGNGPRSIATFAVLIFVYGMSYGAVMGTYGGLAGDRPWQLLYSAVKVPMLLVVTFLLSLPSFFVLNTLLGLRGDFPRVVASLLATQAGLSVILASLAPITAFWYVSGSEYQPAILFNGLIFAVASFSAQWLLRREYRPLIVRHPAHGWMIRIWVVIYVFVGIQMGWVLRPFVGNPAVPVQFFREEGWSNAYVVVVEIIWQAMNPH
jgi:hypothetical protein